MGKKNTGKNTDGLIPWKEGDPSPNPNGRPKGQRNYATIYREALKKIAELNKITPEDLEDDIIKMAIGKARKGDPIFYKDVMDRIHGKPVTKTQSVDENGNTLRPVLVKFIDDKGTDDKHTDRVQATV